MTCDRLMNISRRYTTSIDDAKDVLQNAYLQIFKSLHQFDFQKGTLDNWLGRIVVNEALQQFRKKERVKKIVDEATVQLKAGNGGEKTHGYTGHGRKTVVKRGGCQRRFHRPSPSSGATRSP